MTSVDENDPRVRKDPVRSGEYMEMVVQHWQEKYEEMKRERDLYKEEYERLLSRIQESGQTAI